MSRCQQCCDHQWDSLDYDSPEGPGRLSHRICLKCGKYEIVHPLDTGSNNSTTRVWLFDAFKPGWEAYYQHEDVT